MSLQISLSGVGDVNKDLEQVLKDTIAAVGRDVYVTAKANTPVKSGNARRNWNLSTTKDNFNVENNVPYIERLEAGSSRQAPRGIIMPTLTQIKGKY